MVQVFKCFSPWGCCDWLASSNELAIGPGWLEGELGFRQVSLCLLCANTVRLIILKQSD